MRSQQQTSSGFDSDADPRLAIRRASAAAQRSPDVDDVADDDEQTTTETELSSESRELQAVGSGRLDRL